MRSILLVIVVTLEGCSKASDEMIILTDTSTGCQYLAPVRGGGLTARLRSDGTPFCDSMDVKTEQPQSRNSQLELRKSF